MSLRIRGQGLWNRIWQRRERQLLKNTARHGLKGAVDEPRPGQRFVHGFRLRGWVASESPILIAAYLAGHKVWESRATATRHDVGPTAREFSTFVPAAQTIKDRLGWLKVTARLEDALEGDALTLHEFPLLRGDGGRKLPRWAYGRVWDRDSTNLSDAMDAVAGYTDAEEWERSGRSTADHLLRSLAIVETDDVLEVGCGAARVGVQLAPRCRRWYGADVSPNMLRFAHAALRDVPNTSLHQLNGNRDLRQPCWPCAVTRGLRLGGRRRPSATSAASVRQRLAASSASWA